MEPRLALPVFDECLEVGGTVFMYVPEWQKLMRGVIVADEGDEFSIEWEGWLVLHHRKIDVGGTNCGWVMFD